MRGFLFFLLLTLGAFSGIVLLIPAVMLIFVHSKRVIRWRRKYVSCISGVYFDYAAALIQLIGGTKVYIYSSSSSELLLSDKSALVICNHRSLVDWMFAGWCYALHLDLNANLRVVLKESLRSVPVYGWAMQIMLYIFLSRKREQDLPYIKLMLSYLLCTGDAPSLLLFPEGTDLNDSNKKKSNAYAQMNNLPNLEYVLYPKPSGLLCCLTTLKEKRESLDHKLGSSENHGNNENSVNENGNNCILRSSSNISNIPNIPSETKEHKADCVPYARAQTSSVTRSESKDGFHKYKDLNSNSRNNALQENPQNNLSRCVGNTKEISEKKNKQKTISALHDLTIAYRDFSKGKKTSDRSILMGEFPLEVHILVDRFAIEDVPTDKAGLEQWLRSSFYRKEKLLQDFYECEETEIPTKNWPKRLEIKISEKHPIFYVSIWITMIFSCLYFYSWFRWIVVVMIISCIAVKTFNGFDSVELALHGDMVLREALSLSKENDEGKEKEKENTEKDSALNGINKKEN